MVNRYHKMLRVSAVITAFLLMFQSGLIYPVTKQISQETLSYLASTGTGMYASVPQTEINTMSAQIAEKQKELAAREAALKEREIASRDFSTGSETDYTTYIISAILFIQTVLIVFNYGMDWARVRASQNQHAVS